jgi:transcriptional regulator with XRE-family HTH domain
MPKFTPISVHDLGDYLREQRQAAQLSLRQLSEVAGISNPYISQIERGLKKPSAEILQALAKALRISAESLYVRAGILDERTDLGHALAVDVTDAVLADPKLNDRQRAVLLDVYESFVGEQAAVKAPGATKPVNPTGPTHPAKPARPTKRAETTRRQPRTAHKSTRTAQKSTSEPQQSPEPKPSPQADPEVTQKESKS